jgi:hypothetical protein
VSHPFAMPDVSITPLPSRMGMRCRMFGHEGSPWWSRLASDPRAQFVWVRRCFRCGDPIDFLVADKAPPNHYTSDGRKIE